jgi:molybdopterin molybdotransferase
MISFDEAVELIRSVAKPLGTETVSLDRAAGRVLSDPVIAHIDSPRCDVSAMDGYAVRDSDIGAANISLTVIGESFAGTAWDGALNEGTCARVFTGAAVPRGADRVVMQEKVRRDGDRAIIDGEAGTVGHIRKRGSDFAAGDELLAAGRALDPRAIVAAAAADVSEVAVYRRPSLQILATGDELADPGAARKSPYAIPESVSYGVAALTEQWGAICTARTRLRDDLDSMQAAAAAALQSADVVIVTGGASVGEKDFAKTMFEPLGLEFLISKVSIKPGKPIWLGRVHDKLVMGLPGNPTSALVTARLLLAPLLTGMVGQPTERALAWRTVPLASALDDCGSRETFHRARFVDGAAEILSFQDSSAQKALAEADLLVRQRAGAPALNVGALADVLDF